MLETVFREYGNEKSLQENVEESTVEIGILKRFEDQLDAGARRFVADEQAQLVGQRRQHFRFRYHSRSHLNVLRSKRRRLRQHTAWPEGISKKTRIRE